MARAARRQSEVARLKEENTQLRNAARQFFAGLQEYAKSENWDSLNHVWLGEGDGPKVARKFLGLESKEEKN